MKNSFLLTVVILSIILTSSCSSNKEAKASPRTNVLFTVSDLTDEEFQSIGTGELVNPTKNDFKNIHLIVETQNFNDTNKAKITIPVFNNILIKDKQNRYWYGSGFDQNPTKELTTSERDFVFYSKGLKDTKAIKDYFTGIEVIISWQEENDTITMHYDLGELIMFK